MHKSQTRLITGAHARAYDRKDLIWKYIRRKQLSFATIKSGQSVLDVGCGTGSTIHTLAKKYGNSVHIFGIEPSEDMISQARTKLAGMSDTVKLIVASSEDLPFKAGKFDIVLCSLVLHHLPMAAKKKTLAEIHRVLKPGGVLVLTDWSRPMNPIGKLVIRTVRDHAFVHENITLDFGDMLHDAGFQETKTRAVQAGAVYHLTASK